MLNKSFNGLLSYKIVENKRDKMAVIQKDYERRGLVFKTKLFIQHEPVNVYKIT